MQVLLEFTIRCDVNILRVSILMAGPSELGPSSSPSSQPGGLGVVLGGLDQT
jgi:hypothetical protein